jgi:hypothetical protein
MDEIVFKWWSENIACPSEGISPLLIGFQTLLVTNARKNEALSRKTVWLFEIT